MSVADLQYHDMLRSASKDDAQHHHHRNPPPPIPPSPTLSNPDMILPFDEGERESSTPSPPFNLPSLSNLQSFYQGKPLPNQYGPGPDNTATDNPIGLAWSLNGNRSQKKNFPRHTWTNEGHDASRRLSDIGEIVEEESSPSRMGGFPVNLQVASRSSGSRLAASPILHRRREEDGEGQRDTGSWISSSSSTVSAPSEGGQGQRNGHDTGHSLHMGVNDAQADHNKSKDEGQHPRSSIVSVAGQKGPGDEFSSVILSSEAERILENAKKRLTLMEGNLTRARSSMRASPSPSGTLAAHQAGALYRSISHANRRTSNLRPLAILASQDAANNRHSRVHSETNLSSTTESSPPLAEPRTLSRSVSAMGSSSISSFYNDDRSFRYDPTRSYLTHRASTPHIQTGDTAEEYISKSTDSASPSTPKGLGISTDSGTTNISSIEDFNSAYPSEELPSRAQSQLHVRDLQDQMKGLHIKISSLKVKTQEDNLRRRSLQSLRTPSPFTAADHWYNNIMEYQSHEDSSQSKSSSRQERTSDRSQESPLKHEVENASEGDETRTPVVADSTRSPEEPEAVGPTFFDDSQSVAESLYEDAEEGEYDTDGSWNSEIDREALNEILQEPLDDDLRDEEFPPMPPFPGNDPRPHEEREDAFDYEHFILHSALGNFTQTRMRRESNTSNTSVETTRPIYDRRSVRHSRQNSANSFSTIQSFATAVEREDDLLYWDRKFNDELRDHYPEDGDEFQGESEPEKQGTPRAVRRQSSRASKLNHNNGSPSSTALAVPQRSDSATTGSVTPTALASSLVSTVRAASSPHPSAAENGNAGLNNDDERLLEHLFESLRNVCMELQTITTSAESDPKTVRVLRRRLDAARRVLDGELDT